MITEYFNSEFLTGIAVNKLMVCITDPRVPFKPMLTLRDHKITDRSLPRILFASLFSETDDLIDLSIRLKINWGLCTSMPRLTRITQHGENSDNAKPDSLFRDLNEYVLNSLGGSGYLILILSNLHRLSNDQAAFFISMMKYARLQFGIILISNNQFLDKFKIKSPMVYSEFCRGMNAFIGSKIDLQIISRCGNFLEGISELKQSNKRSPNAYD